MRLIVLLCFVGTLLAQTSNFEPVATVRQLMDGLVIPASDAVFRVSDDPDDDEWITLENNALMLAESGNLLLMRTPDGDNSIWIKESKALVAAGKAAAAAAKAKNADAVMEAGDPIYATCEGCHMKYLKQ